MNVELIDGRTDIRAIIASLEKCRQETLLRADLDRKALDEIIRCVRMTEQLDRFFGRLDDVALESRLTAYRRLGEMAKALGYRDPLHLIVAHQDAGLRGP